MNSTTVRGICRKTDIPRHPVAACRAWFDAPPRSTPSDDAVDGPLLGNGDMGVCLSGPPEALRLFLSKNDFWQLRSKASACGPRVFGTLEIRVPALAGASYQIEQRFIDATAAGTFRAAGGLTFRFECWVAATENLLVLQLAAEGGAAEVAVRLAAARSDASQSFEGVDGPVAWERRFERDVDIPTAAAAAARIIGADALSFALRPGKPVWLVLSMTSRFKHPDPAAHVRGRVAVLAAPATLEPIRQAHEAWWRDYWERGWIEIGDPALEQAYYQSLYTLASTSRDPRFPSGLFGVWVTTDSPRWSGDYHLNYNHQAPYYGLYSANRIEQADPEDAPILDFMERGRWYAREVTRTRGVLYPVGIGPLGVESTRDHPAYGPPNIECGGMFWQQRSNALYCLVNVAQRWRCTYDIEYARRVWPFVSDVLAFWEDYLQLRPVDGRNRDDGVPDGALPVAQAASGHPERRDLPRQSSNSPSSTAPLGMTESGAVRDEGHERYVVVGDAIHEGSGWNVNPILTLGLLRNALDLALDLGEALGVEPARAAKWRDVLARLSDFPTQERDGRTVFRLSEAGCDWWRSNTLGIQHIYPANAIGPDSPRHLLEVARNTITTLARWRDHNGMSSFYPAAVRVGYDPPIVLEQLRGVGLEHAKPNGFVKDNPHGIENCSIVHNTLNEMMCMSHGHVLRLFPVWPRERDARFRNIRAWGAFLVSAELRGGIVRQVEILSERGRECTLLNPWPGQAVRLLRDGRPAESRSGERFTFPTTPGERVGMERESAGCPDEVTATRIRRKLDRVGM